jgi:hypothetical protein
MGERQTAIGLEYESQRSEDAVAAKGDGLAGSYSGGYNTEQRAATRSARVVVIITES